MKVGIVGASGYAGGELLRLLAGHPRCTLSCATSRREKGKPVHALHPNLRGIDLSFEDLSPEEVASRSDFVFTATPHTASMEIVPPLLEAGAKVVDLSGDFRFTDCALYERYYRAEHTHPEIRAAYGLPEIHKEEIRKAPLVANPGCYPTSAILGLLPLLREGWIVPDRIVIDSKSGVSGAGAEPSRKTHFPLTAESVLPYRLVGHRHLPEIEEQLRSFAPEVRVSFVPHLVPLIRGISTTLHTFLLEDRKGGEVRELFAEFYREEPFVRVLDVGEIPRLSAVRGSNYLDIGGFEVDPERGRLVLVTALDNLVKGAAGQAIQNMNLMAEYPETAGLEGLGLHP
jgi:N-acetyl-gamma-glutamyl-phosphate reductase